MTIAFTKSKLPFGWMGNMAGGFPIVYQNVQWKSSEHLFQAMRFLDVEIIEKIRNARNAFSAKIVAKQNADKMVVQPTSEEDMKNMRLCLRLKINQHADLSTQLLDTGTQLIVEDVTKRGSRGRNHVWGASFVNNEWVGQNILGKMWMEIRQELREL